MSKKLDNLNRVYAELRDRYGSEDKHVQTFRGELDVLESEEFRRPTKLFKRIIKSSFLEPSSDNQIQTRN